MERGWQSTSRRRTNSIPIRSRRDRHFLSQLARNRAGSHGKLYLRSATFFRTLSTCHELQTPGEVEKLFQFVQPYGPTPTGHRLDELMSEYIGRLERAKDEGTKTPKPVNFIVITDGVPTDDPKSVIIAAARRLDAGRFLLSQVGIQFIQIGDDSKATKALKELDDGLSGKEGIRVCNAPVLVA